MRGSGRALFLLGGIMEEQKKLTGYPSIDKPWLKYYSREAIDAPLPECSLYEYLYECNKEHMEDYALNYFGNRITFRKLFDLVDRAAKSFLAIGVREGDMVPIVSVSTVASVVCFYALNRIGAVVDFLNVLAEEDDLVAYFEEARAKVVVTLDLFGAKVEKAAQRCGVKNLISFDVAYEMPLALKVGYRIKTGSRKPHREGALSVINWIDFLKLSKGKPAIEYTKDPRKMCLLAHTGGTTGEPKTVMVDDNAMNVVAAYYKTCFQYTRGEVWANVIIPFVIYGLLACLHMPLTLGLEVVIIPRFESDKWEEYIRKYHINYILAAPVYVNVFYENPQYRSLDLRGLKLCGVGGDGMTAEKEIALNEYFNEHGAAIEVLKGYGLSETCATAVTGLTGINKIGSVGIPLIHNNMMIYDNEQGTELTYHEIGEICLQSPSRMIGYMNNEQATRDLFRIHADGSEWLHTGDLGYIDEDGFLFLVGRMKRVILTAKDGVTYKVFPNMSEKVLDENESVLQSCIVGAASGADQVLRAFIAVSKEDLSRTADIEKALRQLCEEKLPSYARPTFYAFRDSLPLTAAGKIDYRALEQLAAGER